MLLGDAFTALLLLLSGVSAVIVSPPTNVMVSCQNVKISVHWNYSTQEPQTAFRGNVRGNNWTCTFETTAHQYDLSDCIWKPEERYMDFMYVTVAAVQGDNWSEAVSSNTFSFSYLKTVHTKCALDFPPVEVKVDESMATVNFRNPLYVYKELNQMKSGAARFDFTVCPVDNKVAQGNFKALCTKEKTCKCDVSFHKGVKKCVTLTGTLFFGVIGVEFRKTTEICARPGVWMDETMLAVILLAILFLVLVVIIICICKVKAWTMKTPNLPKPLSQWKKKGKQALQYKNPSKADISSLSICKPPKSLSCSPEDINHSKDTNHSENLQVNRTGSDYNSSKCLCMDRQHLDGSNPELEAVGLFSDGNGTDDDSADSTKTECVSIEEEVSPYDCPHVLRLDMGDGDMVTGYTGK